MKRPKHEEVAHIRSVEQGFWPEVDYALQGISRATRNEEAAAIDSAGVTGA